MLAGLDREVERAGLFWGQPRSQKVLCRRGKKKGGGGEGLFLCFYFVALL